MDRPIAIGTAIPTDYWYMGVATTGERRNKTEKEGTFSVLLGFQAFSTLPLFKI